MGVITIHRVENDTAPELEFRVTREPDGDIVDLTDSTVRFKIYNKKEHEISNTGHQECLITDATAGECKYVFQTGDIPNAGSYNCDLEITYLGGKIETYPYLVVIKARKEVD